MFRTKFENCTKLTPVVQKLKSANELKNLVLRL